ILAALPSRCADPLAMLSALLAANLVCGVSVFLQPQEFVKDTTWPTHATITLPQGWVKPNEQMYLLEDGKPIISQVEVAAKCPDGSPRWVPAYASSRYANGKPARYELEKKLPPPDAPASTLKVTDSANEIAIDTGVISFRIPRPFAGV